MAAVLPGVWGVNRSAYRQGGHAQTSARLVLASTSLHERLLLIELPMWGRRLVCTGRAKLGKKPQKTIPLLLGGVGDAGVAAHGPEFALGAPCPDAEGFACSPQGFSCRGGALKIRTTLP